MRVVGEVPVGETMWIACSSGQFRATPHFVPVSNIEEILTLKTFAVFQTVNSAGSYNSE
jgi:hypothetical protein